MSNSCAALDYSAPPEIREALQALLDKKHPGRRIDDEGSCLLEITRGRPCPRLACNWAVDGVKVRRTRRYSAKPGRGR